MARRQATAEAPPQTPEDAAPDAEVVPSVGVESETAAEAEPAAAAEAPPRRRGRPPGDGAPPIRARRSAARHHLRPPRKTATPAPRPTRPSNASFAPAR